MCYERWARRSVEAEEARRLRRYFIKQEQVQDAMRAERPVVDLEVDADLEPVGAAEPATVGLER